MKLKDYPTLNREWDKGKIKSTTKEHLKEIGELQYKMYAQQKYSLLIVFQGIDASGKDGLTRGLLRYCNPVGIKVKSFKKPTPEEYAHDFLWRVHQETPARGEIQVFIRSHYEDILVPSVEGYYPEELIEKRFGLINDFEKLVAHNDTRVLKFYLHVSPDIQKERLMERVEMKRKHWKHKDGDWETREKTTAYLKVYERIFRECHEPPWHIVPADKNWQKLYAVSEVVLKTLKDLELAWPDLQSEIFGQEKKA
ncbi:MAG TPA: polyphosphate kinase [Bacteroides sp.]|nr:polyphosphate kinase [Bacteroides sp.]